jgi:hypothetical protein
MLLPMPPKMLTTSQKLITMLRRTSEPLSAAEAEDEDEEAEEKAADKDEEEEDVEDEDGEDTGSLSNFKNKEARWSPKKRVSGFRPWLCEEDG